MLFITLVLLLCMCHGDTSSLKLKKVLVLSRHNLRTPRVGNLTSLSPKEWPKWDGGDESLTKKGALLEGYFGEFFKQWLSKEKLLPEGCPEEDSVYIYANTRQRTKETAKAFVESAFKNCNVTVNHLDSEEMDPLFNPIIHNTSKQFVNLVLGEIRAKIDALQLTEAYAELNRILDLKDSDACKQDGLCDFTKVNNTVTYKEGDMIQISGPLSDRNSVIDTFIMTFYDGRPESEVAWGEITTPEKWKLLTMISTENEDVRFNLSTGCKDIAGPLLKNMSNLLLEKNSNRKFILLVGHDSNLNPVVRAFNFQPFMLPNQYEPIPIGGKLVFQKWSNGVTDFLKIEYIYLSWSQIRDGAKISSDNPPQIVVLELKGCKTDENGLCPWKDFEQILNDMDL